MPDELSRALLYVQTYVDVVVAGNGDDSRSDGHRAGSSLEPCRPQVPSRAMTLALTSRRPSAPSDPFTRPRSSNGGPRLAPDAPSTAANAAAATFSKLHTGMTTPTESFKWWIVDERTGKRRLTTYVMTREEAAERFPDAEPT